MATKKPKSGTGKNKKLTLKKGTVRDLTARRDAADAVRGGGGLGRLPTQDDSCRPPC
jgi:hypothetical protein